MTQDFTSFKLGRLYEYIGQYDKGVWRTPNSRTAVGHLTLGNVVCIVKIEPVYVDGYINVQIVTSRLSGWIYYEVTEPPRWTLRELEIYRADRQVVST